MATRLTQSHGFVWPEGMPPCALCQREANDSIHVTPSRHLGSTLFPLPPRILALQRSEPGSHNPQRPHAYQMRGGATTNVLCATCGNPMGFSGHLVGAPAGALGPRALSLPEPPTLAAAEAPPVVIEGEERFILATKAAGTVELAEELAEHFGREVAGTGPHLWVAGRYVGADEPNGNGAYWSTADLQMGQPTVAHGPVNWLHEEHHIIGAIAGSRFVDREVAAEQGRNPHIVALAAVWPWVYPQESALIQQASEAQSLWFSMECVSREVACIDDSCGKTLPYREYIREKASRCEHMASGRRFVDPVFEGVGIIVPPVRPGWVGAEARVSIQQADDLVERQAASFTGMADGEAAALASQLLGRAL